MTVKRATVDQYTAKVEDRAAAEPITLTAEKIRLDRRQHHDGEEQDRQAEPLLAAGSERHRQGQHHGRPGPAAGRRQGGDRRRRLEPVRPVLQEPASPSISRTASSTWRPAIAWRRPRSAFDIKLAGLSTSLKTLQLKTRDTRPAVSEHPDPGRQEYRRGPLAAGCHGGRCVHGAGNGRRRAIARRRDQPDKAPSPHHGRRRVAGGGSGGRPGAGPPGAGRRRVPGRSRRRRCPWTSTGSSSPTRRRPNR